MNWELGADPQPVPSRITVQDAPSHWEALKRGDGNRPQNSPGGSASPRTIIRTAHGGAGAVTPTLELGSILVGPPEVRDNWPTMVKEVAMSWRSQARRILVTCLSLSVALPAGGGAQSFMYISEWGTSGAGPSQFRSPGGIECFDNRVYVADQGNNRIQLFLLDQNYWPLNVYAYARWGSLGSAAGQFNNPTGVAVSWTGEVYVADYHNYRVQVFGPYGDFRRQWGSYGSAPGQFRGPFDVAVARVDNVGRVYVTDQVNDRVQVFDTQGSFLFQWGGTGSGSGQFKNPCGIAALDWYRIFVSDQNNHRVQVFLADGTFWGEVGLPSGPAGPARPCGIASGWQVSVTDPSNHMLFELDQYGQYLWSWMGTYGDGPAEFNGPRGVADYNGYTLVSDRGNDRVLILGQVVTSARPSSWGRLKALFR